MFCWESKTYPGQTDPPANWTQLYKSLQHLQSIICGDIETYAGQMDPLLFDHKSPEPYYTWQVLFIEKMWHTKGRWTPNNWAQVHRTLLPYSVWSNKNVRHNQGTQSPLLIEQESKEPYYTCTVWSIDKVRHTHGRWTSLLIKHKSTEPSYTWQVWSIEKARHTQGRWTLH